MLLQLQMNIFDIVQCGQTKRVTGHLDIHSLISLIHWPSPLIRSSDLWPFPWFPQSYSQGHSTKPREARPRSGHHSSSRIQRWRFVLLTSLTYLFSAVCLSASAWTSEPRACTHVHSGERLHTKLFVAGLAPWEPILHLSILHSWGPDFTPNFTSGDPFFFSAASQAPLSLTPSALTHSFLSSLTCTPVLLHTLRDSHCDSHMHTSVIIPK